MKVIDSGHLYWLDHLDGDRTSVLRFVKRVGENYPGNRPPAYEGVTLQEVIRALIDRMHYVNAQTPCDDNIDTRNHLREALRHLEIRAARKRNDDAAAIAIALLPEPETAPTCRGCGHVFCGQHP